MRASLSNVLAHLLALLYVVNAQKLDPIKNFCSRFDHQSIVKNDTLYIYGGSETYVDIQDYGITNGTVTLGYNPKLIEVDLSASWDWKTNISEIATNTTVNPRTGSVPPQLVRGALYQGSASDTNIHLYGGTTSFLNTSFPDWQPPVPSTYSLWSYDTATTEWSQFDVSLSTPLRPSSGAVAEAPDQGLAFYFNGEIDSGSSTGTQALGPSVKIFLEGMVVINTVDHSTRNLSTFAVTRGLPRIRGRMVYIPSIGDKGILVLLGGSSKLVNQHDSNEILNLHGMDIVDIFDVSSLYNVSTPDGVWFQQSTTGRNNSTGQANNTNVPSARVDFCAVVLSALDSSSHNVYIYGGRDVSNNYFDDIWVLSLPTFTWTLVYSGSSPRFGHTCHVVGNRTLLTVGGVFGANQMKGVVDVTLGSSACDWEYKGVGVLDLANITWGSIYDAQALAYEVPIQVVSAIGGSTLGNASAKAPPAGFNDNNLARLFGVQHSKIPSSPSSTNKNAIIAGTVSAIGALALIVGITWFAIRLWPKKHASIDEPIHEKDVQFDRQAMQSSATTAPSNNPLELPAHQTEAQA